MTKLLRCGIVLTLLAAGTAAADETAAKVGPEKGWLVIGGGNLGPDIFARFLALAGGADAAIVVIPTARADDFLGEDEKAAQVLRQAGAKKVSLLHTRSRAEADSAEFTKPLRAARGVWLGGGRQWRLADAYLDTRVEKELHAVLDRGGVIGGSSAGASIQASYLVRGALAGNQVMMSPGHERGFAFLRDTAIDQHVLVRHRENDMPAVLLAHPQLLGLGIDEGTAIVVHGDQLEVIGRSSVLVYGAAAMADAAPLVLSKGDKFDLATRRKQ